MPCLGCFKACFGLAFAWFWVAFRLVLGYDMPFSTVPLRLFLICFTSFLVCFTSFLICFTFFLICFTLFPDLLYVFPDLLYVFPDLLYVFPDLLYTFSIILVQVIRRYKLSRTWASVPRPPAPILQSHIVDNLL